MATLKLEANYRSDMSKSRKKKARREGYVTGSVFGRDAEPVSIEVKLDDLVKSIKRSEAGIMSLIDLKIKGAPKKCDGTVIVKSFYKDPLTKRVLDVQFQRVSMKEKIHMAVPIVPVGEARGVKEGGILEQVLDELDVRCLPAELPPRIEVDVSTLGIGDHIVASDITLSDDVEILTDPTALIFTCVPPHVMRAVEEKGAEEGAAEATEEKPATGSQKSEDTA